MEVTLVVGRKFTLVLEREREDEDEKRKGKKVVGELLMSGRCCGSFLMRAVGCYLRSPAQFLEVLGLDRPFYACKLVSL